MAVVYIITNTEGSDEFAIQPGTLNGPDGVQQNTDLRLPGNGLAIWGEAYNENVYRLTESFAVPEKGASPGVPQDEGDLGPGNGINVPLEGQLWWNRTQKKLFVFGGTTWNEPNVVGVGGAGDVPGSCSLGDLFFNTDAHSGAGQLLVCDGSSFVSSAEQYVELAGDTMTGNLEMGTNVINITDPPVAGTNVPNKIYVDTTFVDEAGDTMSGNLNMDGNEVENLPTPSVGTGGAEGASRDYVDTSITSLSLSALTGDVRMTIDTTIIAGWLECNGDTIGNGGSGADHVVANADLFDLVKLGFGNGGGESFAGGQTVNLPNFNGRGPINRGIGPTTKSGGAGTNHGFGTEDGDEEHVLTIPEIPAHTHTTKTTTIVFLSTGGADVPVPVGSTNTGSTGGDGAHNNKSPVLTVLFLIKT